MGEVQTSSIETSVAHSKDCSQYFQRRIQMNENHVVKQNSEEPSAVIPHARICGSTGGGIPGATRHKFFIGFFIAAFVCGIMFICGGVAEAGVLGSFPDIQCAAPVLVKPIVNFVIVLITVATIFL